VSRRDPPRPSLLLNDASPDPQQAPDSKSEGTRNNEAKVPGLRIMEPALQDLMQGDVVDLIDLLLTWDGWNVSCGTRLLLSAFNPASRLLGPGAGCGR